MSQSPPKPWTPGKHPAYTSFRLVINVCQDEFGNVWSDHDFLTSSDEATAQNLEQGGVPQISHALLTEAVRREVFTSALARLSRDPEFLNRCRVDKQEKKHEIGLELGSTTLHVITRTAGKMIQGAVAGVLTMLLGQQGDPMDPMEKEVF